MAVAIATTAGHRVSYGTLSHGATTGLSVGITFKLLAAASSRRVVGQWDGSNAWLSQMVDADELGFVVRGAGGMYGPKTSGFNFTTDTVYRVVMKIGGVGTSLTQAIWVNGASVTVAAWFSNTITTIISGALDTLNIGDVDGNVSENAQFSEFALWPYELSDAYCEAYGKGWSPLTFSQRPKTYSRLTTTTDINDLIGRVTGTNSSGTNAAHPRVIYPRRKNFRRYPVPAVGGSVFTPYFYREHIARAG